MAEIRWMEGSSERVVRLESGRVLEIGRDGSNGLVLDAAEVSRHHARVVPDGDGWAIDDLGSANGTWLEDQRVDRARLSDGDQIFVGKRKLTFFDAGAPPPAERVASEAVRETVPETASSADRAYYLSRDNERLGPYSWPELSGFASNGQVASDDLLWGPGLEEWTAAGLIPGLLPSAPPAACAPPPPPYPSHQAPPRARRSLMKMLLAAAPVVLIGLVLLVVFSWFGGPDGGGSVGGDSQAALLSLDDDDWQHYSDLDVEQKKIERNMEAFQGALRAGDIDQAASWIAEDRRDAYAMLFANRPEAMASFADLLDSSKMTYFSPPEQPRANARLRIAEYTVTIDDFDFYIRWAKVDNTWVLFDF